MVPTLLCEQNCLKMPSEADIADCWVSKCDRKTVPRCRTRNRKCSTAVCGQSVTWDHKCVLLSRPKALPWHDSADWDDMVQQIVRCTAVQTPMYSDDQLERNSVRNVQPKLWHCNHEFKSVFTQHKGERLQHQLLHSEYTLSAHSPSVSRLQFIAMQFLNYTDDSSHREHQSMSFHNPIISPIIN